MKQFKAASFSRKQATRELVRDEALLDGGDRLQPLSEIEVQKRLTRVYLTGWDPPATDFVSALGPEMEALVAACSLLTSTRRWGDEGDGFEE